MAKLTVLHTSDWHLGQQLYRKKRDEEFEAFLDWLVECAARESVDVLVVAGDVFDSGAPGIAAQKMYYDFLLRAGEAGVRHLVITAGNHDSPGFLAAAGQLLQRLRVHVIGSAPENAGDEILVLDDASGRPVLIVCAVPYLRERDVIESRAGEGMEDREARLAEGIRAHYGRLARLALARREELGGDIPILATGHLFAAQASLSESGREFHAGSLVRLPVDIFPPCFDYVALGHIHRPQKVGDLDHVRYCGSPLPMNFSDREQPREVELVRFEGRSPRVEALPVPVFRRLVRVRGDLAQIRASLAGLAGQDVWVEIRHEGGDAPPDLCGLVQELGAENDLQILCVKTDAAAPGADVADLGRGLDEITPAEMFENVLAQQNIDGEKRDRLIAAFADLLAIHAEAARGVEE